MLSVPITHMFIKLRASHRTKPKATPSHLPQVERASRKGEGSFAHFNLDLGLNFANDLHSADARRVIALSC